MKTVAIVAARTGSTRLPGKVLFDLGCWKVVDCVLLAAEFSAWVDETWLATTTDPNDDPLVPLWDKVWRGSEEDVLSRFADCARKAEADIVVRLTGDCCLMDSRIIGEVVALQRRTGVAFANNTDPPTYPDGLDVEVITAEALYAAEREATRTSDRNTVVQYISRNRHRFSSATLTCPIPGLHTERWVLDTAEDYEFCKAIIGALEGERPNMLSILKILDENPELRNINSMHGRNERFMSAIANIQSEGQV